MRTGARNRPRRGRDTWPASAVWQEMPRAGRPAISKSDRFASSPPTPMSAPPEVVYLAPSSWTESISTLKVTPDGPLTASARRRPATVPNIWWSRPPACAMEEGVGAAWRVQSASARAPKNVPQPRKPTVRQAVANFSCSARNAEKRCEPDDGEKERMNRGVKPDACGNACAERDRRQRGGIPHARPVSKCGTAVLKCGSSQRDSPAERARPAPVREARESLPLRLTRRSAS